MRAIDCPEAEPIAERSAQAFMQALPSLRGGRIRAGLDEPGPEFDTAGYRFVRVARPVTREDIVVFEDNAWPKRARWCACVAGHGPLVSEWGDGGGHETPRGAVEGFVRWCGSVRSLRVTLTISVSEENATFLALLYENGSAADALAHLACSAADGVRRPGAWERQWVEQAFGVDFLKRFFGTPIASGT